jgi:hypothetical protein
MFRALTRAGFTAEIFPRLEEMLLISEPEAAAVYTARFLREKDGIEFIKVGRYVTVPMIAFTYLHVSWVSALYYAMQVARQSYVFPSCQIAPYIFFFSFFLTLSFLGCCWIQSNAAGTHLRD